MTGSKCAKVFWFVLTLVGETISCMLIARSMPSKEFQCLIVNNIGDSVACVMDNGFQCFTPSNFAVTLTVNCSGEIFHVFSMEETYCTCCDANFNQYCIARFERTTIWFPFMIVTYPILVQDLNTFLLQNQVNTTKSFFKSNGVMYLSKLENAGLRIFLGCVSLILSTLVSILTAYFVCRHQAEIENQSELNNEQTIELVPMSQT